MADDGADGAAGESGTEAGDIDSPDPGAQPSVVVSLPESLRGELREPMGPIYTEVEALLADAGGPVVAVGDIVTYHLLAAGARPAVALIDHKTKREAVTDEVREAVDAGRFDRHVTVRNPAATLTRDLLEDLRAALDRATAGEGESTVVEVIEGEEDLAALPALAVAPEGASVVYGQPDEGMVLAAVDADARAGVWDLLERMDGDVARLRELLDG
jgi:uncharacterized protein (UPF0218 family)